MNTRQISVALSLCLIPAFAWADERFPKQPALEAAFRQLNMAWKAVDVKADAKPVKAFNEALFHLDKAKTSLELAAKNKGSYGPAARKLIEDARAELEASRTDPSRADKAVALIKEAQEEITKAARAGRR